MDYLSLIFNIVTILIAIGSFIFGICNYSAMKKFKQKTLQISLFSEYTKRYQDIMLHLYSDMENKDYIRLYLDLCSEEYYLYKQDCLPKDVWKMWLDGMKLMMKLPTFKAEWKSHAQHYNQDFIRFFNHEVLSQNNNANSAS